MNSFGNRLLKSRNDRKILQKEIADFLGINVSTYQRYEYGTIKPNIDVIIKLANFFNVSADYLLGLSDDSSRK